MCRPVASLACVTGNGGVRSRDEKPMEKVAITGPRAGEGRYGEVYEPSRDAS